jgi:hypothetical protein
MLLGSAAIAFIINGATFLTGALAVAALPRHPANCVHRRCPQSFTAGLMYPRDHADTNGGSPHGRPGKSEPKVMRMPTMLTCIRPVSHDANPLARQPWPWKVVVAGQHGFGPDTLCARLQARCHLGPILLRLTPRRADSS